MNSPLSQLNFLIGWCPHQPKSCRMANAFLQNRNYGNICYIIVTNCLQTEFQKYFKYTFAKKYMKKIFTLFSLVISLFANSQSTTVVISQVYGGGGSASAGPTYNVDYIELHNISAVTQNIAGFKLMYGSAAGTLGSTASNIYTFLAGASIPAGGYLLLASTASAGGGALGLTPDITFSAGSFSMSATNGKVAFGTSALTANTAVASQPGGSIIDLVGYGTATDFEGTVIPALSTTTGAVRKNNGCTETNNNASDFTVTTNPIPRNSASPIFSCTSTAALSVNPGTINLITPSGTASASQTFLLSGANLTGAPSNISVTPSANVEVSADGTTWSSAAINVAYSTATLANTTLYLRIAATAATGAFIGTVTCAGGGATNAVVNITGGVTQNYYTKPTGDLSILSTWGTTATDGSGATPPNFTNPYQLFTVTNRTTAVPGAHWEVSGTGSKLIIGDGTNATTVTTSISDTIKSTTVIDVLDLSTFEMGSRTAPTFGTLTNGSLVNYTFTGTTTSDTVRVNNYTYGNLKFTGGLKYLKAGTTIVNGNLVIDGTAGFNGAGSPFSTIVLKGSALNILNNAILDDSTTTNGFGNRLTLSLGGSGTQNINCGTSELNIFRLIRDTTNVTDIDINLTGKLQIGNASGGDLRLLQKSTGTPTVTRLIMNPTSQLAIVKNASVYTDPLKAGIINATNANIIINKTVTSTTYPGTLKFDVGATLNNLTVNINTTTKDTIIVANDVSINNNLNLTKGVVLMGTGATLKVLDGAVLNGGNASSYVDGLVSKVFDPANFDPTFLFPLGQSKQYAPIEITMAATNTYTAQYFKQAYSNLTVNAATLLAEPTYNVSKNEYWNISNSTSTYPTNMKFYYNTTSQVIDPTQATIAHFNGTGWDNVGRTGNGSDAAGNYVNNTMITSFSPFTFGGKVNLVLPIQLISFNGSLQNNTSTLTWKTACESAGSKFDLQFSTDAVHFESIYKTDAIGNCVGNSYNYLHKSATAAVNYYRLVSIDADGKSNISNIIALKNGNSKFEIKLLPTNYTTQIALNILSANNGNGFAKIINLQGQVLSTINVNFLAGNQVKYIDITGLAKGLYLLSFTNDAGEVSTNKFVK